LLLEDAVSGDRASFYFGGEAFFKAIDRLADPSEAGQSLSVIRGQLCPQDKHRRRLYRTP
jgi:hypothetical protein